MIAQGQLTAEFESRIAQFVGCRYAIAQGSGTASLILALKALGIGENDGVVLPTYVCRSVLEAVLSVIARPQLCDVDEYGVITPDTVSRAFDHSTKAIIAVHIFGNPCDVNALRGFGVPVLEDACQSFGLILAGTMAGAVGDLGLLSFHATKCLTSGEGGMVVTNDTGLAEAARKIAQGSTPPAARIVAPISDLQAALGLSQLARYSQFAERRESLLHRYQQSASDAGLWFGLNPQCNLPFRFNVRHSGDFEELQGAMFRRGIAIRRGVDELLHRLLGLNDDDFPIAVRLINTTASFPFYPALEEVEIEQVEEAIRNLSCL
jgi:UDP-4-amino-4-deoxy-L-arabinose-oxoglutarate aminotransferase